MGALGDGLLLGAIMGAKREKSNLAIEVEQRCAQVEAAIELLYEYVPDMEKRKVEINKRYHALTRKFSKKRGVPPLL